MLGNNNHLVDVVLAARSVYREEFEGRDEKLLMSLPSWQQKTTSISNSSNSCLSGDKVRSKIETDNSFGKSWSGSSWPDSAVAAFAFPSSEGTPLDRHIQKIEEKARQARYNSEHGSAGSHSGASYSTDELRPGTVSVTFGNSLLDDRVKKSEQASVIIRNQGSAPVSPSQGNRLLNERVAKKLENDEARTGVAQPSVQASTSSAKPVSASASSPQGNRLLNERVAKKSENEEACMGVSQPSVQTSAPGAKLVPKKRKGILGKIMGI